MNRMKIVLEVDAPEGNAIGIKEALAMDVEKYGDVRVVSVEVHEPEQMAIEALSGQASTPEELPRRGTPTVMVCCVNCTYLQNNPGWDEHGRARWGSCRQSGRVVHDLKHRCEAWRQR